MFKLVFSWSTWVFVLFVVLAVYGLLPEDGPEMDEEKESEEYKQIRSVVEVLLKIVVVVFSKCLIKKFLLPLLF